jgi:hypothetical protein
MLRQQSFTHAREVGRAKSEPGTPVEAVGLVSPAELDSNVASQAAKPRGGRSHSDRCPVIPRLIVFTF